MAIVSSTKIRFDNYTLYKITPRNVEHLKLLQNLQNDIRFDFWKEPVATEEFVTLLAAPKDKIVLEELLDTNNVGKEIVMSNLQE